MKSLKALTAHLNTLYLFDEDQFVSFADSITLQYRNDTQTQAIEESTLLFDKEYEAVFMLNDFTEGADELFSHIMLWLMNQGYDFDLGMPTVDVEPIDDERFDIEITIKFVDPVFTKVTNTEQGFEIIEPPQTMVASELKHLGFEKCC